MSGTKKTVDQVLQERGKVYGNFANVAQVHIRLMEVIKEAFPENYSSDKKMGGWTPWNQLPEYLQCSVDMICMKLARFACGNPTEPDNFRDIAGYAQLALSELERLRIGEESLGGVTVDSNGPPATFSVDPGVIRNSGGIFK